MKKIIVALFFLIILFADKTVTYAIDGPVVLEKTNFNTLNDPLSSWEKSINGGSIKTVNAYNEISPYLGQGMVNLSYSDPLGYLQLRKLIPTNTYKNLAIIGYFHDPGPLSQMGLQYRVSNQNTLEEFIVGVKSSFSNDYYFIRPGGNDKPFFNTKILRTTGWHKVEIKITPSGTYALIDNKNTNYLPTQNSLLPINQNLTTATHYGLATTWKYSGEYFFDEVSVLGLESYQNIGLEAFLLKEINTFLDKRSVDNFLRQGFMDIELYGKFNLYHLHQIEGTGIIIKDHTRDLANLLLAKAFKCKFQLNESQACVDEVILLIHSLLKNENYERWKGDRTHDQGFPFPPSFNYPSSPLIDYPIALSSWLLWEKLPNSYDYGLKGLIFDRLSQEANFWSQYPDVAVIKEPTIGDSNAEELAWTSAFLAIIGNMFPNSPNSNSWLSKSQLMMQKTISPGLDNDYKVDNHGMFHPGYALYSLASLSEGLVTYKLSNKSYNSILSTSDLLNFYSANLNNTALDFTSFRYHPDVFIKNGVIMDYGGKDDWFRAPDTSGASAFSLLSALNISSSNEQLNNLLRFRYDTDQENFIPYILSQDEISKLNTTYRIDEPGTRLLIETIQPLYDIVSYLWKTNTTLSPLTVPEIPTKPGDLNKDLVVNIFDLRHFLTNFLQSLTIFHYSKMVENFGR